MVKIMITIYGEHDPRW